MKTKKNKKLIVYKNNFGISITQKHIIQYSDHHVKVCINHLQAF